MLATPFTLLDTTGRPYRSHHPGTWGGHSRTRIYGRLDCPVALLNLARGIGTGDRVFFADEETAVAAGYRPCGGCCPERFLAWQATQHDPRDPQR